MGMFLVVVCLFVIVITGCVGVVVFFTIAFGMMVMFVCGATAFTVFMVMVMQ